MKQASLLLLILAACLFTSCEDLDKPSDMSIARQAINEGLVTEISDKDLVRIAREPDKHRAQFIKMLMKDGVNGVLTRDRAITLRQREQSIRRANEIRKMLIYDYDADGRLSQEDFELIPEAEQSRQAAALRNLLVDAEGRVSSSLSYDQVIAIANERASQALTLYRGLHHPEILLAFDANKDDAVDAAEILAGVSSISAKYTPAFDVTVAGKGSFNCPLPPAAPEDKIILLGAYGADSLSSVTIGSDDTEVRVVRIDIEKGETPLYIAVASYEAIIWQFEGAVERVNRFAVKSRAAGEGAAGVTGLEKEQIVFLDPSGCLKHFGDVKGVAAIESKAEIIAELGRGPDLVIATRNPLSVHLPSGRLVDGKNSRREIEEMRPNNVDRETWQKFMRFNPGGVIEIDPKTVVATHPVKPYTVLPQQAGLVQLMREGKIKRLSAISGAPYVLLESIGRYPIGLAGARGVSFIVPKGVPVPGGSSGHSSVYFEGTGECTGHGNFCREVAVGMHSSRE